MTFTASENQKVNDYISGLGSPHQDWVIRLRETAYEVEPGLKEDIKWRNCLVFTTKKNLTQLVVGKQHMTLIFFEGIQLADPKGLLEGDGNKTRNVKITSLDADWEGIGELIRQAVGLYK